MLYQNSVVSNMSLSDLEIINASFAELLRCGKAKPEIARSTTKEKAGRGTDNAGRKTTAKATWQKVTSIGSGNCR